MNKPIPKGELGKTVRLRIIASFLSGLTVPFIFLSQNNLIMAISFGIVGCVFMWVATSNKL